MKMNPMVESSARRRMRTGKTPVIIAAYLLSLLGLIIAQLAGFADGGVYVDSMRQGMECYIWMTALQLMLILLVAPALGAGSIAGERERQTFDLLLVTGTGSVKIVWGKMMEHAAFLLLLIVLSAPLMATVLVTGGVTLADVLMTLLYLAVIALAALGVGIMMSVWIKRTLGAVIMAYVVLFALGVGSWALAKRGPFAAAYTYQSLEALLDMSSAQVIATMPITILMNPAVGLVMLLAGQTGILHRTMESTLRLGHIYSASKVIGFTPVALVILVVTAAASMLFTALACALLHIQTGARYIRGK